ncbi:MAG: transcriptional regulator [Treponema sp.]|nr:MAG: transcriptional regulator [Treponema sp.]
MDIPLVLPPDHDSQRISSVEKTLLSSEKLNRMAQIFKLFGDPSRLKIINALKNNELCVHEITALMGMSQPAVSQQLRQLKQVRVVASRREGKRIYYYLNDEHIIQLFEICRIHLEEEGR